MFICHFNAISFIVLSLLKTNYKINEDPKSSLAATHSTLNMALPTLARRCITSALRRQCSGSARLQTGSISAARFTPPVSQNATCGILRSFSSTPSQPTTTTPPPTTNTLQPPTSLTPEAGLGAQDAMKLFIQHVSLSSECCNGILFSKYQK